MSMTAFSRAVQKLWERWLNGEDLGANGPKTSLVGSQASELEKIDGAETSGLSGTHNSLAYRVEELEKHVHNRERWFGKSADQSGNNWGADTLTPYRAISGNGVYGADVNDEAKIAGTDDTPIFVGSVYMDIHRILVVGVSVDTHYKIRIIYGAGTMADAITAGQYTEVMIKFDSANPQTSAGIPIDIMFPRIAVGSKVWAQAKNTTDNATIDFFVGGHEYPG